ncbi:hypothetical protein RJT34_25279 [Clitoria ternatea]|uniref:Uncharacterized protein n=1 Tax=Clitoria ternatea TaxID=43366 RepID=A0AAN9FPI1_CLITE
MTVVSCRWFSFLSRLFLIIIIGSQAIAQQLFPHEFCDNNRGNFTINSTYHTNLNTLLSTLSSNTEINYGFYNFSYGEDADKVYAIGLCRGDQMPDECRSCLDDSRGIAASGGSRSNYAVNDIRSPANYQTIYGLVQCTPDLSEQQCNDCLDQTISYHLSELVYGQDIKQQHNMNRRCDSCAYSCCYLALYLHISKEEEGKKNSFEVEQDEDDDEIRIAESLQFNFDTIRVATSDFSNSNKLGQGGFGTVYSGKLSDGQEIAVKRLSSNSGQGDTEFKNEVLLAMLQHRNLVRLLVFCLEGREREADILWKLLKAWRNWREGTVTDLVDPSLSNSSRNEMIRCIHIGLLCVQENIDNRPTWLLLY